MKTFGQAVTAALRFGANVGGDQYAYDQPLRDRAQQFGQELAAETWTLSPHWWRTATSGVTIDGADDGVAGMPTDFGSLGAGQIYVSGRRKRLEYMEPTVLLAQRQISPAAGDPLYYTLHGMSAGVPILYVYPSPSVDTDLDIENYNKKVPDMIDIPLACTTADSTISGNPDGVYDYQITFLVGLGETEGGIGTHSSVTVVTNKVQITGIAVSPNPNVTARGIYRNANGSEAKKLVAYLSDNVTTTYLDDIADITLGNAIPTPLTSVNGLEQFPSDFHDTLFVRTLMDMLAVSSGDARGQVFNQTWERKVKRMWADQKQGQNVMQVMPKYGQGLAGGRSWRERIPIS